MNEEVTTKKIKFIFSEDYNPLYINGAFGTVGANGEVMVTFYHDRLPVPRTSTLVLNGSYAEETFEGTSKYLI